MVELLRVPHFSHTKKLNLVHEKCLPLIYSRAGLQPKVNAFHFLREDPRPCNARRVAHHVCPQCVEEVYLYNERRGVVVCAHCGYEEAYEPSYGYKQSSRRKVMPRYYSSDFYKRVVHFRYWLYRLQAKEKNNVTSEDLRTVREYLEKEHRQCIDYDLVKTVLKKTRLQKHYDHVVFIMNELRGKPLVLLTTNQEQVLISLFLELQPVFGAISNRRVNMLSYPYVIRKLCELKGWTAMARVIPTLKSHSRLFQQDELWREICRTKGWTFRPTRPY